MSRCPGVTGVRVKVTQFRIALIAAGITRIINEFVDFVFPLLDPDRVVKRDISRSLNKVSVVEVVIVQFTV